RPVPMPPGRPARTRLILSPPGGGARPILGAEPRGRAERAVVPVPERTPMPDGRSPPTTCPAPAPPPQRPPLRCGAGGGAAQPPARAPRRGGRPRAGGLRLADALRALLPVGLPSGRLPV